MYLDEQIITYLGNKRKLLDLIVNVVKPQDKVCFDVFSGSGIVSRAFKENGAKRIIANDLEDYSRIINECYLTNYSSFSKREYEYYREKVLTAEKEKGIFSNLYAPQNSNNIQKGERCFFTAENALILDSYVKAINKEVPQSLQCYFLAPLMSEASIHANTSGVFKGFYKNKAGIGQWGGEGKNALTRICGEITLQTPIFSSKISEVEILQENACSFSRKIECDVAYLDPPYNQHPYGSNYFMLNLIANYVEPKKISKVSGIPTDWNRSEFNKEKKAAEALEKTLSKIKAARLVVSYNNEGFISYETMLDLLSPYGEVGVITEEYPTFRGCRNLSNRDIHTTEYLFVVNVA